MRLNRVLLLAATINILIFALVLTISCSGDNGPRGNAGKEGCRIEEDSKGDYSIFCTADGEENFVGTLYKNGVPGKKGDKGPKGENCWLGPFSEEDGYQILCGTGTSKGYMKGCSIEVVDQDEGEFALSCGASVMNLCGLIPFDTKEYQCSGGSLEINDYEPGFCGKNKEEYDTRTHYCGWAKGDDPDDYESDFPGTTVYAICGPKGSDLKPFEDAWDDDIYCRWTSKTEAIITDDSPVNYCNGERYNEQPAKESLNGWKAQYCGFTKDNATRAVLTGACDEQEDEDTFGPSKISHEQGYCEVEWDDETKKPKTTSVYSEKLCGVNGKPNNGEWKGEYCGHTSTSPEGSPTKVYSGRCTEDGKGPHEEKYNAGYCTIKFEDRKTKTKTYLEEDGFCDEARTLKPNEGGWKNQYCGVDEDKKPVIYDGLCDDGSGPNQTDWTPKLYCKATFDKRDETVLSDEGDVCDDGSKPNEGSFKYEYCGFATKKTGTAAQDKTTKRTNGCDDGDGPDMEDLGAGYCWVTLDSYLEGKDKGTTPLTSYTTTFCGKSGKLNEGSWKKQYCGLGKKDAEEADKVWDDMCDDGKGPAENTYPVEGYCQWPSEDAKGTVYADFGCGEVTGTVTVNKNQWLGEYCWAADSKVAKCPAGLKPNERYGKVGECTTPITFTSCDSTLKNFSPASGNFNITPFGYVNSKCAFKVASTSSALTLPNVCPTDPGPATNKLNSDAQLYVDCAFKFSTASNDAKPFTTVTKSTCEARGNVDGKPGQYFTKGNVRIASIGTASEDFTQVYWPAPGSTLVGAGSNSTGANGPAISTASDNSKHFVPICVAKATPDECERQGYTFSVSADKKTVTITDKITTTGKLSTQVASSGRCEFTPPSLATLRKKARK
jgi:hypothetical protein